MSLSDRLSRRGTGMLMSLSDRLSRLMWLSHGGSKILMRLSRPMSLSDRISRRGTGMLMSLSDRLSRRI